MSDPGTTYRSRDEVQSHRKTTDPITKLGLIAIENKLATAEEFEVPSSLNRRNWTKKPKITCTPRSRQPRKIPKSV